MIRYFLAGAMLAMLTGGAYAQQERSHVYSRGAWTVNYGQDRSTGQVWCEAQTYNRAGQTFDITGFADGSASVYVIDPSWALEDRPVSFRIDIDYSRWNIDGSASGTYVAVALNESSAASRFIAEMMRGSAVAVYNAGGARLGRFSLRGSFRAIESLMNCWNQISSGYGGGRDPFGQGVSTRVDPF